MCGRQKSIVELIERDGQIMPATLVRRDGEALDDFLYRLDAGIADVDVPSNDWRIWRHGIALA